ncbi:MAG: hypothetical protein K0R51_751 [Cytophagaceae bacterium]|jgi:hypothetical protein|nr:hypothetical protein [Cytophagaceae bacterium]
MILPYDNDYQETKQILLGLSEMKPEFRPLADWVDETFGVKTINIVYDTIEEGTRPRLELCFEFEEERNPFYGDEWKNFDGGKQKAIASKFKDTLEDQGLYGQPYRTENIWIIYGAFEPIARIEANQAVRQEELDDLQLRLNNKDLWLIRTAFSGVTFFLHTDKQVKHYEKSPLKKEWADRYFDLLEPYNEFAYFKRETFDIYLDSKENFDKNYAGNWFYYYQ